MYHPTYDIKFVAIGAFFNDTHTPCYAPFTKAIHFIDNETPDWEHMLRVTDCILYSLEIEQSVPMLKHDILAEGFWIPYMFKYQSRNCSVRVFPGPIPTPHPRLK